MTDILSMTFPGLNWNSTTFQDVWRYCLYFYKTVLQVSDFFTEQSCNSLTLVPILSAYGRYLVSFTIKMTTNILNQLYFVLLASMDQVLLPFQASFHLQTNTIQIYFDNSFGIFMNFILKQDVIFMKGMHAWPLIAATIEYAWLLAFLRKIFNWLLLTHFYKNIYIYTLCIMSSLHEESIPC